MPRFYMHVRDGADLIEDSEGIDFPDLNAARHEALTTAKESVAEHLLGGGRLSEAMRRCLMIVDENGMTVSAVSYAEAADTPGHHPGREAPPAG